MSYGWSDLAGIIGVSLIVGAYLMMQLERLDSRSLTFSALNAAGAALIITSLVFDFNMSAMVVEVFWLGISLVGIGRSLRRSTNDES